MAEWKNETALVAAIVKTIKANFPTAFVVKVHGGPMQEPGLPDLLLCIEGCFIGLEVKHQKRNETPEHARDRATPFQRIQISRINDAGGMASVVLTPEEALETVHRAINRMKENNARDHQE